MRSPRVTGFREGVFSLVPSVLGVALVVTLGFVFVVALILMPLSARRVAGTFCTPDDVMFQAIRANQRTWIDQYARQDVDSLDFTMADGEQQTVYSSEDAGFFVIMEKDTALLRGAKGYQYAPNGLPETDGIYRYTALEGNIYCYES